VGVYKRDLVLPRRWPRLERADTMEATDLNMLAPPLYSIAGFSAAVVSRMVRGTRPFNLAYFEVPGPGLVAHSSVLSVALRGLCG